MSFHGAPSDDKLRVLSLGPVDSHGESDIPSFIPISPSLP